MSPTATELDQRRHAILDFIVGDYIRTAEPVASQQIARQHTLNVSPATIRNDMAELEELGFISRPHASAGAVPADPAYRLYVDRVTPRSRVPRSVQGLVQRDIHPGEADAESWARGAAVVLSQAVRNLAITTAPRVFRARIKQLQLVQLQDRHALLVLVMQEARLRQRLVLFDAPKTQEELNELSAKTNSLVSGKTADEVRQEREIGAGSDPMADLVVSEALELMAEEEQAHPERAHLEGLAHMLGQPEFAGGARAQQALEVLEDENLLSYVMPETPVPGDVQVIIGEEHRHRQLLSFSAVLSAYGLPGTVMGVVCTFGPTRMDYARAIASVRYLSQFLSTLHAALDESRG